MTPHYTHSYDHMSVKMHMIRGVCGWWMGCRFNLGTITAVRH